jgi:hypothetical protein
VFVEFSENGFEVSSRSLLFVDLQREYPQIRSTQERKWARGRQFRVLHIRDREIQKIVTGPKDLKDFQPESDRIRFEIIPEDQRECRPENLTKVTQVMVGKDNRLQRKKVPFLLPIEKGIALDMVREKIRVSLGKSEEAMTHYRFMIKKATDMGNMFNPANVLRKDAKIGQELFSPGATLLMIVPADESALEGSRRDAVKILT